MRPLAGKPGSAGPDATSIEESETVEPEDEMGMRERTPVDPTPRPRVRLPGKLRALLDHLLSSNSVITVSLRRLTVLTVLLLCQSMSSNVLEEYESILKKYIILPLFLTTLCGAGGNAGTQATIRAITGLVCQEYRLRDYFKVLRKELCIGVICGLSLAAIGYARIMVYVSQVHEEEGTLLSLTHSTPMKCTERWWGDAITVSHNIYPRNWLGT
eukprot:RCo012556